LICLNDPRYGAIALQENGTMLRVTVEELRDAVILHCCGRIVRGEETAILCAAVQRHQHNIILDFSQVDDLDAAGVGALIALRAAGIFLRLMNPTPAVREVLKLTRLESILEISEFELSELRDVSASPSILAASAQQRPEAH
jgi:anti-anti-sigma factor